MTFGEVVLGLVLSFVIFLVVVAVFDLIQRKHAIKRNFPIIGNLRYLLELIGPELRQYIVTSNDEERPFSRDQRRWVYASSKNQNNYFGFGTDNDLELSPNYLVIKHCASSRCPRRVRGCRDMIRCIRCLGQRSSAAIGNAAKRSGPSRPLTFRR